MSKPRYGWWPYAKSMVRRYPDLVENHDGSRNDRREYEAVTAAIREAGEKQLQIIQAVYWDQSDTITTAAAALAIEPKTARRWHKEFMLSVAKHWGLLD